MKRTTKNPVPHCLYIQTANLKPLHEGFATDGEVKRQLDSLLAALEREATHPWQHQQQQQVSAADTTTEENKSIFKSPWRPEDPSGRSYRLMQYNPPYTLPWIRSNAIAVRVTNLADSDMSTTSTTTEVVMDGNVDDV